MLLRKGSLLWTFEALFDMSKGHVVVLLFYPLSLGVVQSLFKSVHYDLVNSLSLSISLQISRSGIPILYTQIKTIFPEGFAIKLKTIIRDECIKNPESSYNVLLDEPFDINISNVS